jgi:predicted 3-demethylubiquinone-9 3-methyltransferase (glyoxalase superfamily)
LCTSAMEEDVQLMDRIVPCLWFDHQAEEAATFYVSSTYVSSTELERAAAEEPVGRRH